jgi:hypothetical protein
MNRSSQKRENRAQALRSNGATCVGVALFLFTAAASGAVALWCWLGFGQINFPEAKRPRPMVGYILASLIS